MKRGESTSRAVGHFEARLLGAIYWREVSVDSQLAYLYCRARVDIGTTMADALDLIKMPLLNRLNEITIDAR